MRRDWDQALADYAQAVQAEPGADWIWRRFLGFVLDLVGAGAGYERWKTTPQYQEWLKETGQKK